MPEVVEDADTFAGNARKKASETAQALGLWVVADDSGLAVDVLGGAPGVHSARYAGSHGDDAANNRRLLAELHEVDGDHRGAAFVCALRWPTRRGPSTPRCRPRAGAGSSVSRAARADLDMTLCF